MFIPVAQPVITKNAKKYLLDCIDSGWVSSKGPYVERFEKAFAEYHGVRFATTTTSGTTALHLALVALRIGNGDEVIVPTFTMIAPVFAILYTGAKPVLVDCEKLTWNMDVSQIEKKINEKTKAIIAVHIYGHPVDMDPVLELAKKYNLSIIEDAAEGLGSLYKGKKVGSFGDVSCFSFYANKLVTTGEGGIVLTKDKTLHERLKRLKDMSHSFKRRFLHTEVGYNFRMTNLQAALGLAGFEIIKQSIQKKRKIAKLYLQSLKHIDGLFLPVEMPWAKHIYWMFCILLNGSFRMSRQAFRKKLLSRAIETRDFFIPMHRQPALLKMGLFKKESYPVADDIYERGIYLPSGLMLTDKEIRYVCKSIKELTI